MWLITMVIVSLARKVSSLVTRADRRN